jgi:hypothetical protein
MSFEKRCGTAVRASNSILARTSVTERCFSSAGCSPADRMSLSYSSYNDKFVPDKYKRQSVIRQRCLDGNSWCYVNAGNWHAVQAVNLLHATLWPKRRDDPTSWSHTIERVSTKETTYKQRAWLVRLCSELPRMLIPYRSLAGLQSHEEQARRYLAYRSAPICVRRDSDWCRSLPRRPTISL